MTQNSSLVFYTSLHCLLNTQSRLFACTPNFDPRRYRRLLKQSKMLRVIIWGLSVISSSSHESDWDGYIIPRIVAASPTDKMLTMLWFMKKEANAESTVHGHRQETCASSMHAQQNLPFRTQAPSPNGKFYSNEGKRVVCAFTSEEASLTFF